MTPFYRSIYIPSGASLGAIVGGVIGFSRGSPVLPVIFGGLILGAVVGAVVELVLRHRGDR